MNQSLFGISKQLRGLVLLLLVFSGISAVSAQPLQPAAFFRLVVESAEVDEGHTGQKTIIVRAVFSSPKGSQFNGTYSTQNGTATAGSDYITATGSISLKDPGTNTQEIQLSILGDSQYEPDETFELVVTPNSGTVTYSALITIKNDDTRSFVRVDNPQVQEGTAASQHTQLVYQITRSGDLNHTFNVIVSTADGTTTANEDYIPLVNHVVQFGSGVAEQTVIIKVVQDAKVEPAETLLLNLTTSDPTALITKTQGIGTILDDDLPLLSISDGQIIEGNTGHSTMTFTLTLSQVSHQSVHVSAHLANITATKDQDYSGSDQIISFAAGETTQTFNVEIIGDEIFEPDEIFVVNLESPDNVIIEDDMAIATIINDDVTPPPFAVTGFSLIDAKTDTVLIEDFTGGTIDLTSLGVKKITIRANTNPATVGSVRFSLNGKRNFRKDNAAPYTLAKDVNGNLKPWKYTLYTEYTLTATAFSEKKAKGLEGGAKTITFKITKQTSGSGGEAVPTMAQGERWLAVPPAP